MHPLSHVIHVPCMCPQDSDAQQLRAQLAEAKAAGDLSVAPVWSGTSVGLIRSIEPAEDLVAKFAATTASILKRAASIATE